jgi:hypothetical protein
VRRLASALVDAADLEQVIAMTLRDLHGLHEGNLARYRLRPSEFLRWAAKHRPTPADDRA